MSEMVPIGSGHRLPEVDEVLARVRAHKDGESTSAQLRRIAQERTQLAVALRAKDEELRQEQTARAATQADLTRVEGERDTAETWAKTLNGALIAARAELESARQELALRRTQNAEAAPTCTSTVDTKGTTVRCTKQPDGHDTHLGRHCGWDVIW